jgi:hypothetical protein
MREQDQRDKITIGLDLGDRRHRFCALDKEDPGLTLAAGGTSRAKKRAVVAVARKLAVLLLTLWKNKSHYQAFPGQDEEKMRTSDRERLRCTA